MEDQLTADLLVRVSKESMPNLISVERKINPTGSAEEKELVQKVLHNRYEYMTRPLVMRRDKRCHAEWNNDQRVAVVTKIQGNIIKHFGKVVNGKHILYPEDALLLLELNRLELTWNGVPFSIMQGYAVLLCSDGKINIPRYRAYREFCLLGYRCMRPPLLQSWSQHSDDDGPSPSKVIKIDSSASDVSHYILPERMFIFAPTNKSSQPDYEVVFIDGEKIDLSKMPCGSGEKRVITVICNKYDKYCVEVEKFDSTNC